MKKLSVCFFVVMCLFITGCNFNKVKEVASLDNFNSVLAEKNFNVDYNSGGYSKVEYIVAASKATLDNIEIEMIEYTDKESASKVQNTHIDSFNLVKSTGALENKDKGKNYYKYSLVSNGYYMVSSRIDNTLMFCKTSLDNKELVEEVFNSLGY